MRKFIGIILVIGLTFSSCCKTKECRCDLEEAYVNPEAQKWVEPLTSQRVGLRTIAGKQDELVSDYFQYFYCIGEGDCCTDFPYLTLDFTTDSLGLKLFHVTALKDDVTFSSPDGGQIGILTVTTNTLKSSGDINMTTFSGNYAGNYVEGVHIENTNLRSGIAFITLDYIQTVGVISYMGLDSTEWRRK